MFLIKSIEKIEWVNNKIRDKVINMDETPVLVDKRYQLILKQKEHYLCHKVSKHLVRNTQAQGAALEQPHGLPQEQS